MSVLAFCNFIEIINQLERLSTEAPLIVTVIQSADVQGGSTCLKNERRGFIIAR